MSKYRFTFARLQKWNYSWRGSYIKIKKMIQETLDHFLLIALTTFQNL